MAGMPAPYLGARGLGSGQQVVVVVLGPYYKNIAVGAECFAKKVRVTSAICANAKQT